MITSQSRQGRDSFREELRLEPDFEGKQVLPQEVKTGQALSDIHLFVHFLCWTFIEFLLCDRHSE